MKRGILFTLMAICFGFLTVQAIQSFGDELENILKLVDNKVEKIDKEENSEIEKGGEVEKGNELSTAITLLHKFEVTKFDSEETFMPNKSIRRDEAAKMMTVFAENILEKELDIEIPETCKFGDLGSAHSDLPDVIRRSCAHKIFKWHNGNFMPTSHITNAEVVTVIMRIVDGYQDETDGHFATNYFKKAGELEDNFLLEGLSIDQKAVWDFPATRETVAVLLYRAENND